MSDKRKSLRRVWRLTFIVFAALAVAGLTSAGGQTRRSTRQRSAKSSAATQKPTPTPLRVPQLPRATPVPTPPVATVTSNDEDAPPPPPKATPTPAPPKRAETIEDDSEVIRVTSNLVVVPTSVVDAQGNPVQGLKTADFQLEEEGKRQEIAEIGVAEQVPLDIALVFDVSSSTVKNFDFMKQAAAGFLREVMKPNDRAAVFTIGEKPSLVQALAGSNDAAQKLTTIPAATKSTGTAFYDTVTASSRYLAANSTGRSRRVILVITDGEDNFSNDVRDATLTELNKVNKATGEQTASEKLTAVNDRTAGVHRRALQKVMKEVQQADAVFYSINPSGPGVRLNVISQRAEYGMSQLSEATGGSSFLPASEQELPVIFRRIAAELRAQYLLQYYPQSGAPAGKFLRIRVTTPARTDLRVRARQGYYVQKGKG